MLQLNNHGIILVSSSLLCLTGSWCWRCCCSYRCTSAYISSNKSLISLSMLVSISRSVHCSTSNDDCAQGSGLYRRAGVETCWRCNGVSVFFDMLTLLV